MRQDWVGVAFARQADVQLVLPLLESCGLEAAAFEPDGDPGDVDLVVLDEVSARRSRVVWERKPKEEIFWPVLVCVAGARLDFWLQQGADMCLPLPISRMQLRTSAELLLRLRRQARDLLQKGEERYLSVFEATGTASLVVDAKGVIVMANRQCFPVTGYTPEELVGTHWSRYVAPESLEMMRSYFSRRMAGQPAPAQYETLLVDAAGQRRYVIVSAGMAAGDRQAVISMVDVTQLRRTQEELARSEELFRNLFEKHSAVKLLIDPQDGRIVDANEAAERFYGWKRGQLRAMRISDINTLSPEQVKAEMEKARQGQKGFFEFRHRRADGSIRDVAVFSSRIDEGRLLHSIIHDITESKAAQERNILLATAIEQASESIVITDPKGVIEYVNPAFSTVTGYVREEVLGKNMRLLKSGLHDQAFYRELWTRITNGDTWRGRFFNRRKDGRTYVEDAAISPVYGEGGGISHYVSVRRDVTRELEAERAQEALQAQLRQAQRMESVGRLAGGIAHDFNNILGVILGYGEMVLGVLAANHPVREDVREMVEAARRAAGLTRQLLAFSRQQPIRPDFLDMDDVVRGVERMLGRLLGEDIRLELDLRSASSRVEADRGQVEQVIMNLAINARDAMPQGGLLRIGAGCVRVQEETASDGVPPGDYVLLRVEDTGTGMPPEVLERIFEPFFTTKDAGKGTGLGLSVVYGIVTQAHGFVRVRSTPGQGTVFFLYWPAVSADVPREKPSDQSVVSLAGGRALVVEDEESLRRLLGRVLKKHRFDVQTVSCGEQAVSLVQAGFVPDLLVTDIVMPGIDGMETARRIRQLVPGVKVLCMSGYFRDRQAAEAPGEIEWFLQKPFSVQDLENTLRKMGF